MTSVTIYCSIRYNDASEAEVKFFSERACARIDQQLQEHFLNSGKVFITPLEIVVDGTIYVPAVTTNKEYRLELEKKLEVDGDNLLLQKALKKVKSL